MQSEHKSGSSLMSSAKKKKKEIERIKSSCAQENLLFLNLDGIGVARWNTFSFNSTDGQGEKGKNGTISTSEKDINPVAVTHKTVKTVSPPPPGAQFFLFWLMAQRHLALRLTEQRRRRETDV